MIFLKKITFPVRFYRILFNLLQINYSIVGKINPPIIKYSKFRLTIKKIIIFKIHPLFFYFYHLKIKNKLCFLKILIRQ